MKRIILFGVLAVVIAVCGYMISYIIQEKRQTALTNSIKQTLPAFSFNKLSGEPTDNSFIPKNAPVCLFYFNTDCEHCQYEAKAINSNIMLFKGVQIIMVSFNTPEDIIRFAKAYGLDKHSQITFLVDKEYHFSTWFGKASIPSVYIYNSAHQLVKEYHGEVKVEAITKHFQ